MIWSYLLGSIIVFILIKISNKFVRDDECYSIVELYGWSMFFMVLASWWGLLAYFVYVVLAISTIADKCPNKNQFLKNIKKMNDFMLKIFR